MLYHFHVTENAKQIMQEEGESQLERKNNSVWVIGETLEECVNLALTEDRMRKATMYYAQQAAQAVKDNAVEQIPDTCKDTFLYHRKNKYKGVLPKIYGGGVADVAADGLASVCNMPVEEMTEGKAAVMCFSLWQDMIFAHTTPSERRFAEDFLAFYGESMENSALFYMFCGFLGGMDFARTTSRLQEKKGQKVTL